MIGTRLTHYRIDELLGSGGMGVVYRARDELLERDVAIKLLPPGAMADEDARRQFRKEALSLSRLNHPNVQAIYELSSEGEVDFIVLELVPGPTLADRIRAGPLSAEEVARFGQQLCDGLDSAHRNGVLHRDIKPANLKITPEGRLKILDFGLARFIRTQELTNTETLSGSAAAGTLPYMAPEQIRGQTLDARTDIHAVGAVLYEMASARRAFPQDESPALIAAILEGAPTRPREHSRQISKDLERIILHCLEKDPRYRYPSAKEVGRDLGQLAGSSGRRRIRGPRRWWQRPMAQVTAAMICMLAVAAVLVGLDTWGLRTHLFGGSPREMSVAVLPLANMSGDPEQEYFADGMTEEIITRLSQIGALRVISRSSVMSYKGVKKPLRAIAKELNVALILEGSAARSGDRVRVSATLIDPLRERHLWAESYQRNLTDVFLLQSDLARAIVEHVRVQLTPHEKARLASAGMVNPEAHQAVLKGLFYMNQFTGESLNRARSEFERAIEIDPTFAPAHAGLGQVYFHLSGNFLPSAEAMPRARAACLRAIELDPRLASAYATLGSIQSFNDWNWKAAERSCLLAIDLSPNDATARTAYGGLLTVLGRFRDSEEQFRLARGLDPLSGIIAHMSLWPLFEGRQFDRAAEAASRLVETDPTAAPPRILLAEALLFQGHTRQAIAEFQRSFELDTTLVFSVGWLGYAYAVSGQKEKALETLRRLEVWQRQKGFVQRYLFALIHVGLRDKEKALDLLERAVDEHSDEVTFLKVDPTLDPLRSEPRFKAMLQRVGLAT